MRPGKMLLVDTRAGRLISDEECKARYASRSPYGEWLDMHLVQLSELPVPNKRPEHHTSSSETGCTRPLVIPMRM